MSEAMKAWKQRTAGTAPPPDGRGEAFTCFSTTMGWVAAVATSRGLRRLSLPAATAQQALEAVGADGRSLAPQPKALAKAVSQVSAFLRGEPVRFTVPLDLEEGPAFFRAVWDACLQIPRGERRTYAWLAARAGRPRAARAAGQAMARNPIPLIIPCHRVVAGSGGLGGYGGGLAMKAALLATEERGLPKAPRRA